MMVSFVQAVVCYSILMMMIAVMMMMMMMTTTTTTINNGDYFRCYTATAFVSLPTTTTTAAAAMTRTSTVQVLQQPFNLTTTITITKPKIQYEWIPMIIQFNQVYKSYGPPSFWRKITSSVPRREFALENITITFGGHEHGHGRQRRQRGNINDENENESGNANDEIDIDIDSDSDSTINLLVGASSSGKSTILKSILETDDMTQQQQQQQQRTQKQKQTNGNNNSNHGSIHILPLQKDKNTTTATTTTTMMRSTSKPILLDDRNDVSNNDIDNTKTKTVQEEWTVRVIHELEKRQRQQQRQQQCSNLSFAKLLVKEMAVEVFCLDLNTLIVDMTPSEKYRLCLGHACIESSISRMEITVTNVNVNNNSTNKNKDESQHQQQQPWILHYYKIPGPILLLDEYMDVETSTVIQKVQPSLHNIVSKLNGIVLSVTHTPNLYSSSSSTSTSTISGTRSIVQVVHGDDDDSDNEMQQQKQKSQQKEQIVRRITLSRGKINSVN